MDIKNLFKRGKKVSWRKFRSDRRKSPMMKELFGTNIKDNNVKDENQKKLAEIFDRKNELTELNRALYDKSKGGLTKTEMKEVIGGLKTLTEKERYKFAKVIFSSAPSGKRFIRPKENLKSSTMEEKVINSASKDAAAPTDNASMTPVKMAGIMNRIRTSSTDSPENEDGEKSKGKFSQALAATRKNKRG